MNFTSHTHKYVTLLFTKESIGARFAEKRNRNNGQDRRDNTQKITEHLREWIATIICTQLHYFCVPIWINHQIELRCLTMYSLVRHITWCSLTFSNSSIERSIKNGSGWGHRMILNSCANGSGHTSRKNATHFPTQWRRTRTKTDVMVTTNERKKNASELEWQSADRC